MGSGTGPEQAGPGRAKHWEVVMTWGVVLGLAAVLLIALGPHLVGDVLANRDGGSVPTAALTLYSVAGTVLPPFSAAFVGAALVMRHAESLAVTRSTADGARADQGGASPT